MAVKITDIVVRDIRFPTSDSLDGSDAMNTNPNYSAAYYHGGRALESLGDLDAARSLYEEGIAATMKNGDAHTRSELQAALDLL